MCCYSLTCASVKFSTFIFLCVLKILVLIHAMYEAESKNYNHWSLSSHVFCLQWDNKDVGGAMD